MLRVYIHVNGAAHECDSIDNGLNLQDQHDNQSSSKIRREGRTIPNLIYHIEDYERYLIQLSRITKVNLMRHAKRSTARDFKIADTGKKARAVAHRSRGTQRGGAQRVAEQPAEPGEEGEEPEEEREEEGEEGDEEIGEQGEEGEEEEPVNEGVDEDETEDNVAEDLEAEEVGAGDGEENDAVVADSDEEAVQAVPAHISESRQPKGSVPKRRRVVDSDSSDDEQPVSHQVSAKRQR